MFGLVSLQGVDFKSVRLGYYSVCRNEDETVVPHLRLIATIFIICQMRQFKTNTLLTELTALFFCNINDK